MHWHWLIVRIHGVGLVNTLAPHIWSDLKGKQKRPSSFWNFSSNHSFKMIQWKWHKNPINKKVWSTPLLLSQPQESSLLHETDDDWNSFFEIVLIDKCETKELLKVNRYIVELLILCQLLLVTVPTRVQGMFSCPARHTWPSASDNHTDSQQVFCL